MSYDMIRPPGTVPGTTSPSVTRGVCLPCGGVFREGIVQMEYLLTNDPRLVVCEVCASPLLRAGVFVAHQ